MDIPLEAFVEPKKVEPEFLTEEEIKFFSERAGEINYLMGSVSLAGKDLAEFSIYFFHLGREFEKGQEFNGS